MGNIDVILYGKGRESVNIAEVFRSCPYTVTCSTCGGYVWSHFRLPENHLWWLEAAEKDPAGTVGLESIELLFPEKLTGESEFSRGETSPTLEISPCKSYCPECPLYRTRCEGCPATVHYIKERF